MIRFLLVFGVFVAALTGCKKQQHSDLQVFIAEKDARPGLHAANFKGLTNLGQIPDKPDLVISELEKVSFPQSRIQSSSAKSGTAAIEDRTALVLKLTKSDADALSELTKKHIGDRLLVLLNNEPLFAPEISTPSIGQEVYIQPPTGTNASEIKTKLETLVPGHH